MNMRTNPMMQECDSVSSYCLIICIKCRDWG